jgi:hypothetical protein
MNDLEREQITGAAQSVAALAAVADYATFQQGLMTTRALIEAMGSEAVDAYAGELHDVVDVLVFRAGVLHEEVVALRKGAAGGPGEPPAPGARNPLDT